MKSLFILVVVLSLCGGYYSAIYPDQSTVDDVVADIKQLIETNKVTFPLSEDFPLIAGLVRLAFHDCVGAGNCDGCIDHNLGSNAGLQQYTDMIDPTYDASYSNSLSRADYYAIASLAALEVATAILPDKFTGLSELKVGRDDCSASPGEDETGAVFPAATFNNDQVVGFFDTYFGFTPEETTALMGAHSLGRAHGGASGFEGRWIGGAETGVENTALLDNKYFNEIDGPWVQVRVVDENGAATDNFQWQRPLTPPNQIGSSPNPFQPTMFLNADMALAYDFPARDDGIVTCRVNCNRPRCCSENVPTNARWQLYKTNNAQFIQDFQAVFLKMINKNTNEANLQTPATTMKRDPKVKKLMDFIKKVEIAKELEDVVEEVMEDMGY